MTEKIYQLIFELCDSLKEEKVYQDYIAAVKQLDQDAALIYKYKEAKEAYIKAKPLMAYQDFSDLKQEVLTLSQEVSHLESYQRYFKTKALLEERLNHITTLIFGE